VSAEAGGCSRPRRYGGSPAHVGAAAAAPRGGGGPRSPRDHPQPWQPRIEERCWHKAVPPRVGLCLASVAPPRRQGGEGRVPRLYALTASGQAPQEESVRQDQKIGCWDQRWGGRTERIKE
jgi:hypothetical protein